MKILLPLLLIFCFSSSFASDLFAGKWIGTGEMTNHSSAEFFPIKLDIQIQNLNDKLILSDCVITSQRTRCYESAYDLVNLDQIFNNGQKIGNIYPGSISIFYGNAQVSEQMVFKLQSENKLHYRYTYSNFDGMMETRFGILTRAP